MFSYLASLCDRHDLAWDCGTGNGQAALGLAGHFAAVLATDASAEQLAHAHPHPRVTYRRTREAASELPSASADLVAAAQAFHWFDAAAFFGEARRVARPAGVVAIWCYGLPRVSPEIDSRLRRFHDTTVGPDWPSGRTQVTALYRTVAFPFAEPAAPAFTIERSLELTDFGRYVGTWSAVARHRARTGRDPVPDLLQQLLPAWGPSTARPVTWPIGLRVGRVPG